MPSFVKFSPGKYNDNSKKLVAGIAKAGAIALRILGYQVRDTARKSIKSVTGHWAWLPTKTGRFRKRWVWPSSPVGTPPHTHAGSTRKRKTEGALPASILYDLETAADSWMPGPSFSSEPTAVVIGPSFALLGTAGKPHEHAGSFRGDSYPQRPFMGPALAEDIGGLPGLLADQIDKQRNI